MKTKIWIFALLLVGSVSWVACDEDDGEDNPGKALSEADQQFAREATLSNKSEIELGQLAASRGSDSLVRAYADMMVDEHTAAQNELEDITNSFDDVDLPNDLSDWHEDVRENLMENDGAAFDSIYIASQIMAHERADSLFKSNMNNAKEARIKAYAAKYHPRIVEHHMKADSIQGVIMMNDDMDDDD